MDFASPAGQQLNQQAASARRRNDRRPGGGGWRLKSTEHPKKSGADGSRTGILLVISRRPPDVEQDPKRKPVSVSSDVQRTVLHTWRPDYRSDDARRDRAHPTGRDEARPVLERSTGRTSAGPAASEGMPGGTGGAVRHRPRRPAD